MNEEEIEKSYSITDLLKIHEGTILKFVESSIGAVHKRIDGIIRDVQDLKTSANFHEEIFDGKLKLINEQISSIQAEMVKFSTSTLIRKETATDFNEIQNIRQKIVDLENRSRRNNLRFDGLADKLDESWDEAECKLFNLISEACNFTTIKRMVFRYRDIAHSWK